LRLLLDTHVWLWSKLAPDRLSRVALATLRSRAHELWLSPISAWEAGILEQKGKIELHGGLEQFIAEDQGIFRSAPISMEVAIKVGQLRLWWRDPADSFLAATAMAYDLVLFTADRRLLEAAQVRTLPA